MRRNTEGRRSLKGLKPEVIPVAFFALMLIYTFYNLFLSQYNIFKLMELKNSSKKLEEQLAMEKEENERREKLLELIKAHPEHFKEKFARQYMQLQKDGEYMILFNEK